MLEDIKNETLEQAVKPENPLKQMLVDYVGNKLNPENGEVTVLNIVEVLAEEFPEFLMAVAEENFIRGYQQAFADIDQASKLEEQKLQDGNTV